MAYAGLRPGEALALQWGDIREKTILVERALSLGREEDTKTTAHRTVRLLGPLRADLAEWRLASGRPADDALLFPSQEGTPWTEAAYQSWRRRSFRRALDAANVTRATPYTLRHSFASLLLHEGRSVIYVARQLGHDARLTLTRYGHVMDELEDAPRIGAEDAIRAARVPSQFPGNDAGINGPENEKARTPHTAAEPGPMELGGLEPPTSWVRFVPGGRSLGAAVCRCPQTAGSFGGGDAVMRRGVPLLLDPVLDPAESQPDATGCPSGQ